jgi:serine/threonine protein kinase
MESTDTEEESESSSEYEETSEPLQKWNLKDFDIKSVLGHGRWGDVYLAQDKQTKNNVALKMLSKKQISSSKNVDPQGEIEIQSNLKHPNIVKLFGWFHDRKNIYIVLEYVKGADLYDYRKTYGGTLGEAQTATFVLQISRALEYCHSKGVVHRDLKLENVLLDISTRNVKLIDFGFATKITANEKKYSLVGTIDYLSPEMVESRPHSFKVDNWALGVLTYELLFGKTPFECDSYVDTYRQILKVKFKFPDNFDNKNAKDFISSLLKKNAKERLELKHVEDDLWIKKYN